LIRTRYCGSHRPPTKAKLLLRSVALERSRPEEQFAVKFLCDARRTLDTQRC
jgi:hypothetical protein